MSQWHQVARDVVRKRWAAGKLRSDADITALINACAAAMEKAKVDRIGAAMAVLAEAER